MVKRRWPTNYRLWALITGAIFVPLGFVDLLGAGSKGESSLWAYMRLIFEGQSNTRVLVSMLLIQALLMAIPAAAIAWVIQAIAVLCGMRLTGGSDNQVVLDFQEPKAAAEPGVHAGTCQTRGDGVS